MEAASRFLSVLFEGYADAALRLELRCLHPARREASSAWFALTPEGYAAAERAAAWMVRTSNVYVGVLPRTGRRRFAVDVPAAQWLWCEVDGKEGGQAGALSLLKRATKDGLPVPALCVGSGGGVHAYWRLAAPFALDIKEDRQAFHGLLRRLAFAVGGLRWDTDSAGRYTGKLKPLDVGAPYADPSCCETARILRVPGTHNHKPERNCAVKLLRSQNEPALLWRWWDKQLAVQPYSPPPPRTEQAPLAPGEVRGLPPKTIADLDTCWPVGTRHEAFTRILYSCRRSGYDAGALEIIGDCLIDRNGADRRHVAELVRDTLRRVNPY